MNNLKHCSFFCYCYLYSNSIKNKKDKDHIAIAILVRAKPLLVRINIAPYVCKCAKDVCMHAMFVNVQKMCVCAQMFENVQNMGCVCVCSTNCTKVCLKYLDHLNAQENEIHFLFECVLNSFTTI